MTVALLGENLIFLLGIRTDPFEVSGKTQASLSPNANTASALFQVFPIDQSCRSGALLSIT